MIEAKIVQIGSGVVARIHRINYPKNVQIGAIVVRDLPKYQEIIDKDPTFKNKVVVSNNLKQIYQQFKNNIIWDIVSDDKTHFDYTYKILNNDSLAKIMLGKTPYQAAIINKFIKLSKLYPNAKLTITENYAVSKVTNIIKQLMEKYYFNGKKIILEFSKNRIKDIKNDRFIHQDIGVLGYEGSHILTILNKLDREIIRVTNCKFEDLKLSKTQILKNQGSAKITGYSKTGKVIIYTAMNGKVLTKMPLLQVNSNIGYGDETRYRILIVDDGDKQIIGQYDPVPALADRPYGRVWVLRDDKILEIIDKIYDNTMEQILNQQIQFLIKGDPPNPLSIERVKQFLILEEIYQKFKN